MINITRFSSGIDNVFLVIFCFFPLATALFRDTIYFYFYAGIAWLGFLLYKDSCKKTIVDLWKYVLSTPFCLFLGAFAIYIAFNFYLISPYKSPTFGLQFLPFHVTSAFGIFLLYVANRKHFNDKAITYSLSSSIVVYLGCCFFFVLQNFDAAGLILRNMVPFLFVIISCLLVMAVYKMFRQSPQKKIFIYTGIVLINALVAFSSDGNTTKLIFLLSLIIAIISYLFKKILFTIMSLGLVLALVFPLLVANLKDFTILNTNKFAVQVRSIQSRIPQWITAIDSFKQRPLTGLGVYASYYMIQKVPLDESATLFFNHIANEPVESIIEDHSKIRGRKLNLKLEGIFKRNFLVERTNYYYSSKNNISDPVYADKFVKAMRTHLEYIDQMIEISQELVRIEANQTIKKKLENFINDLQKERSFLINFVQEYNNASTYDSKNIILRNELKRFFDYYQFDIITHPHNIIVQVLLELGIAGALLLSSILFFILYKISQIEDLTYRTIGYILFFIFVTIYSTASSIWYIDFHQIMYIVAFIFTLIRQNDFATAKAGQNKIYNGLL